MKEFKTMKTKILSLFAAVGMMASFTACDDHNYISEPEIRGTLSFASFGVEVDESQVLVESSRAATPKPNVKDFLITIKNKATGKPITGYGEGKTFSSLPGVVDLPVGEYIIKAESHKPKAVEFDNPYFVDSTFVKIEEDKITEAETMTCVFQSVKVSVKFSENLKPDLGNDVSVTLYYGSNASISFGPEETRSVYFAPVKGASTLVVSVRGTVKGEFVDQSKPYQNVKPGSHYSLTITPPNSNANQNETGTIAPGEGIEINTSIISTDEDGNVKVEEETLGDDDRPGKEDPEDPNGPDDPNNPDVPTPPADDEYISVKCQDSNINVNEVIDILDGAKYVFDIAAKNGIAHLEVEIDSPFLTEDELDEVGLTKSFDLAEPGNLANALSGINLPIQEEVIGKEKVEFDLSSLIPLLKRGAAPGQLHNFILTVTDQTGAKKTQTLTFRS